VYDVALVVDQEIAVMSVLEMWRDERRRDEVWREERRRDEVWREERRREMERWCKVWSMR
jgi:hypothetical protein